MKKLILLFMIVISSFAFGAKKLYVGTNAEFKPYEYLAVSYTHLLLYSLLVKQVLIYCKTAVKFF